MSQELLPPVRTDKRPGRLPKATRAPETALSDAELRFIDYYLIDFNATQAAIKAGYAPTAAVVSASRLLSRGNVQIELRRRQERMAAKHDLQADRVIMEIMALAYSSMKDYVRIGSDGLPYVNLTDVTDRQMSAIQEITVDSYVERVAPESEGDDGKREVKRVRLKLYDRRAALVDLGKHLGLFKGVDPVNVFQIFTQINNGMSPKEAAEAYLVTLNTKQG